MRTSLAALAFRVSRLLPVGLTLVLPARAGVLVVDQALGAGSDFATLQAAVDAAADGDTLLVRDGTYARFTIDGKSLGVVADGPDVRIDTTFVSITVLNLTAEQAVLVQGLQANFGVAVADCQGAVWFDRFRNTSATQGCLEGGIAGASVARSSRVTFTSCTLVGAGDYGGFTPPSTGVGLDAGSASVQLFDCLIEGGRGVNPSWHPAQPGGAGLRIAASSVTVVGCTIRGGGGGLANAGFGGSVCTATHPPGGAGLAFVGTGGSVRSAESTAVGGVTSLGPLCPGVSGPAGPTISGSGTIVALPGFARQLSASSPVRGGETLVLDVDGVAGDLGLLLVSLVHEPFALLNGSLLVGLPATEVLMLGDLGASGVASLAVPVPSLSGSTESVTCYVQGVFLDASATVCLGAGTSVVLLAAGL